MKTPYRIIALILILGFIVACSSVVYLPKAPLDTPSRHVENGMKLLNIGKVTDAFREFQRAQELDPNYPPAYVGMGLCYGLMGDYKKGLETMEMVKNLNWGQE